MNDPLIAFLKVISTKYSLYAALIRLNGINGLNSDDSELLGKLASDPALSTAERLAEWYEHHKNKEP